VEAAEIEIQIDELEQRVDRLRALYEQYFMGIEKLEPTIQRKDVDRRVWVLRREQIRNTGLRFRFNNTIQRYNTLQQYWSRILREIEAGTYKRDVRKVAARFGADAVTGAAKRRFGKLIEQVAGERDRGRGVDQDIDVDVELGDFDDDAGMVDLSEDAVLEEDRRPAAAAVPRRSAPVHSGFGDIESDDFHSPDFGDEQGFGPADVGFGSIDPYGTSSAPAPSAPRAARPGASLPSFGDLDSFESDDAQTSPNQELARWANAQRQRSDVPSGSRTDPAPPPTDPPLQRPSAPVRTGLLSSLSGSRRAPAASPSPPAPNASARSPSPRPAPGSSARAPSPAPAASPAPRPASPNSPAAGAPARPASAAARSPVVPAQPATAPSARPAETPQRAAAAPAASAPRAAAAPARPVTPQARPSPPAAPPGNGSLGLSGDRVRKIYESYVQARRACRESTSNITEGKLEEMLRTSVDKLRSKHAGKSIDFDVVIKDGKAVLKPVVKG